MSRILFDSFDTQSSNLFTSGTATGTSTAASSFQARSTQAGASAGSVTVASSITAAAIFTGTSAGSSTVQSVLSALARFQGSTAGASTATGSLSAVTLLSGASAGSSACTSSLAGIASFLCTVNGSSIASSTLSGLGSLSGSAFGTSTASAIIIYSGGGITYVSAGPYVAPKTLGPLKEYYIFYPASGIKDGPYTYAQADGLARQVTRDAYRLQRGDTQADVYVIVGERQGDPTDFISAEIVSSFLRGTKIRRGITALRAAVRQGF
jgi:hypothetical protein